MRSASNTRNSTSNQEGAPVAFFDLDRTLISINSGRAWVSSEYKLGHLSAWQLTQAIWWITRYKLGWAELEAPLRHGIRALKGEQESAFIERVELFFEDILCSVRPKATEVLRAHQSRGERSVLITTSSIYLARLFGAHLGFTDVIANRFEVREGLFTGEPEGPLCFGEGKLELARRHLQGSGTKLSGCSFYSDSYSDLPLLSVVGRPIVVTPDRLLRREALAQSWPILEW